jgi:hypothetical protein
MTEQGTGPGGPGAARQPTEEELQAAYEAELKRIRVDDVLIQTIVSLLNLGGRRAGLAPGTENERDLDQVRLAVDAARALLPLIEDKLGPDASTLRDALSQLQMAYAQLAGGGAPGGERGEGAAPEGPPAQGAPEEPGQAPTGEEAGPAQRSGRLWIPGQ